MKILLKDDYVLSSDNYQFILQKKTGSKTNEDGDEVDILKGIAFHGDLKGILQSLKRRKILSCDATTWKTLIDAIKEIDEEINEINEIAKLYLQEVRDGEKN